MFELENRKAADWPPLAFVKLSPEYLRRDGFRPPKPSPHLEGPLAVQRQRFSPPLGLVHRIEALDHHFGIVVHLAGIERAERLGGAEQHLAIAFVRLDEVLVAELPASLFIDVHGVDEASGQLLRKEGAVGDGVGQIGEQQPLHEAARLAGDRAEIDRRTDHQSIGRGDPVQQRRQAVLHGAAAVALPPPGLAGEAAGAPPEVQVVQVDQFCLGPLRCGPFQGLCHQSCRVPLFAGTAVDTDDLHRLPPMKCCRT